MQKLFMPKTSVHVRLHVAKQACVYVFSYCRGRRKGLLSICILFGTYMGFRDIIFFKTLIKYFFFVTHNFLSKIHDLSCLLA